MSDVDMFVKEKDELFKVLAVTEFNGDIIIATENGIYYQEEGSGIKQLGAHCGEAIPRGEFEKGEQ